MHPSQLVACGLPELDIGSSSTASWWKIMMITLGPVAHCYSNAKFSRVFNFNVNSATNDLLGFVEYTSSGVRFGEGSVAAGVKNSYESVLTATTPITWLLAYGTCQRTVAIDRLTDSEALGILTKSRLKQGNSTPWGEPDLTVKSGNDSSQNPSGPSSAVIRIKAVWMNPRAERADVTREPSDPVKNKLGKLGPWDLDAPASRFRSALWYPEKHK
ncbi:hypothetical protein BD779DRAFT_1479201 [Infundibulicybe gibba]|nr:hypothetical protein BD779DRAFT_1479201 [Infundibulicybe gibba]